MIEKFWSQKTRLFNYLQLLIIERYNYLKIIQQISIPNLKQQSIPSFVLLLYKTYAVVLLKVPFANAWNLMYVCIRNGYVQKKKHINVYIWGARQ